MLKGINYFKTIIERYSQYENLRKSKFPNEETGATDTGKG